MTARPLMPRGGGADDASVPKRLLLVVSLAAALALVDLAVKAVVATGAWDFHRRSHWWVALSLVLLCGAIAAARLPSRAVAVAAGVLSGGVLGNLVSAGWYGGRVPNPIVVEGGEGAIAFNLADVFALTGILLLMVALSRVTVRHRHLLPTSTVAVRAARRMLERKEAPVRDLERADDGIVALSSAHGRSASDRRDGDARRRQDDARERSLPRTASTAGREGRDQGDSV